VQPTALFGEQLMKVIFLIFINLLLTCFCQKIPCLIWRNSFLEISTNFEIKNETVLSCRVRTLQTKGWMAVGFSPSNSSLENSLLILASLPENFYILKNHTGQSQSELISEVKKEQSLSDIIDGIYEFSFKINSSVVAEKNFVYFASNEEVIPPFSNFSLIPKHKSFSKPMYLNLKNKNELFPFCEKNLNLQGRLVSRYWFGYSLDLMFSIFIFILMIYFRNDQPLKSRYLAPKIGIICLACNCFSFFLTSTLSFEEQSVKGCIITGFITYPMVEMIIMLPTLITIRYTVLLRLYIYKRDFIRSMSKKSISSARFPNSSKPKSGTFLSKKLEELKSNSHVVKITKLIRKILLVFQSPNSLTIASLVWFLFFESGMFVIFAIGKFKCNSYTMWNMKQLHLYSFAFVSNIFIFFVALDFISNIKNIVRCRCKRYFIEEDPFHFRVDFFNLIILIPLASIWLLMPMPSLVFGIVTDMMYYFVLLLIGGLPLLITIIKKLILVIKSNKIKKKTCQYQ
jgi:hypothetical protein